MALTERLAFVVSMNSTAAVRGFQAIGDAADKELTRAQVNSRNLQSSLNKFGAVAVGSSIIAGRGLMALANDASDLEETLNKSRVTFGDAAGAVEAFGDQSAQSIGQSKRDAIEAASSFGALFRTLGYGQEQAAQMGVRFTKLASDLASFSNTTPEEAIIALGAALRGEQEPIRRYNILLNDQVLRQRAATLGLGEFTGTLPPAVRAQAAYAEILAQTTLQQGDFARTASGAANQQRILSANIKDLRANIGQGALPALTNLTGGLNAVLGGFNSLPPAAQTAVGTMATFATATGGVLGVGALATSQILKLKETLRQTEGATGLFGTSLSKGGAAGLAAAVGLGVLTSALGAYKAKQAAARAEAERFAAILETTGGSLDASSREGARALREEFEPFAELFADAGISFQTFSEAVGDLDGPAADASDALQELQELSRKGGQDTDVFRRKQAELAAEIRAGGGPRNELIAQLIESGAATRGVGDDFDSLFDRVREGSSLYRAMIQTGVELAETNTDVAASSEDFNEAMERGAYWGLIAADSADELRKSRSELLNTTLGLFDAEDTYNLANLDFIESVEDLIDAEKDLADARKTADPSDDIQAQRELERAYIGAGKGAREIGQAAVELAAKQRGLTVDQLGAAEAARIQVAELSRVRDTLAPNNPLRAQLDDYINALVSLDRTFTTEVQLKLRADLQQFLTDVKTKAGEGVLRLFGGASVAPGGVPVAQPASVVVNVQAGAVLSDPLALGKAVENALNVVGRVNGGVRIPIAS